MVLAAAVMPAVFSVFAVSMVLGLLVLLESDGSGNGVGGTHVEPRLVCFRFYRPAREFSFSRQDVAAAGLAAGVPLSSAISDARLSNSLVMEPLDGDYGMDDKITRSAVALDYDGVDEPNKYAG